MAVTLFTEGLVFKGVAPGGVIAFPMGVEFVKLVGGKWSDMEEGMEEDLRVFVISGEDRVDRERGK